MSFKGVVKPALPMPMGNTQSASGKIASVISESVVLPLKAKWDTAPWARL